MTGALLLGMLRRERYGFAKIGFESAMVLALRAGSVTLLFLGSAGLAEDAIGHTPV